MLQLNAMLSPAALQSSLEAAFPRVQSCMAYGSSVFTQKNHDSSSSLIDLVFEVQDPVAWHAANLERNPSHYSFLKLFGASAIADFQQNYGAGVYYNTLVIASACVSLEQRASRLTICVCRCRWRSRAKALA